MNHSILEDVSGSEDVFCTVFSEAKGQGGSTATVCILHEGVVHCANVGDSRAIAFDDVAAVKELTVDHNPTEGSAEHNRIKDAGGIVVKNRIDNRLNISRSIGDFMYKTGCRKHASKLLCKGLIAEPHISSKKLKTGSLLIIASDGVWGEVQNRAAADIIQSDLQSGLDLKDAVLRLGGQSKLGSEDNVSIISVQIH